MIITCHTYGVDGSNLVLCLLPHALASSRVWGEGRLHRFSTGHPFEAPSQASPTLTHQLAVLSAAEVFIACKVSICVCTMPYVVGIGH